MSTEWFVSIDDPDLGIRPHLRKHFQSISKEDLLDGPATSLELIEDDPANLIKLARTQYANHDDKWTITLAHYCQTKAWLSREKRDGVEIARFFF